jgi:transcriptional regulator with XRE-family HTH domain
MNTNEALVPIFGPADYMRKARRFHGERIGRPVTLSEWAEKLGFSRAVVSGWERGTHRPSLEHIARIHEVAGIAPEWFMEPYLRPAA